MKSSLLRPLSMALAAVATLFSPVVWAQDDKNERAKEEAKDENENDEPEEDSEGKDGTDDGERNEFDAGEFKQRIEENSKIEKAAVDKMMKVFKPLSGEWIGKEKVEHKQDEFRDLDKAWDDEWTGVYTMGGRYFEMSGQTSGDNVSTYKWICTWDHEREFYIAWYFGDNTQTQYLGKLSDDSSHVVWRTKSGNEGSTEFTMKATGERVKCYGEDKDRSGNVFSTQRSSYTRKKLEL